MEEIVVPLPVLRSNHEQCALRERLMNFAFHPFINIFLLHLLTTQRQKGKLCLVKARNTQFKLPCVSDIWTILTCL